MNPPGLSIHFLAFCKDTAGEQSNICGTTNSPRGFIFDDLNSCDHDFGESAAAHEPLRQRIVQIESAAAPHRRA